MLHIQMSRTGERERRRRRRLVLAWNRLHRNWNQQLSVISPAMFLAQLRGVSLKVSASEPAAYPHIKEAPITIKGHQSKKRSRGDV